MKVIKLTKSKYYNNYYGLKVGDKCLVVGTKVEQLVVYNPKRDVKTSVRPFVILRRDCEYEEVIINNFFVKLYYKFLLWRVSRVLKVVNTKGITPYKK